VEQAPQEVAASFYLATLLLERGAGAEARAVLDDVLRRDPGFEEARQLRAQVDTLAEPPSGGVP
jgi:Tfp pilus assembly protein PilF